MADKQVTFQDQLRRAIDQSGQTRYQICKATGIDQANLSRFMNGGGMSIDTIDQLFAFLHLAIVPAVPSKPRSRNVARKAR